VKSSLLLSLAQAVGETSNLIHMLGFIKFFLTNLLDNKQNLTINILDKKKQLIINILDNKHT
jgi:hypothetical protein